VTRELKEGMHLQPTRDIFFKNKTLFLYSMDFRAKQEKMKANHKNTENICNSPSLLYIPWHKDHLLIESRQSTL